MTSKLITANRVKYLCTSIRKVLTGQGLACPSCGSVESVIVSRKYIVTTLRRCCACHLLFRTPTTTAEESLSFYQSEYSQGFTTDTPSLDQLEKLKTSEFKGSEKDYSQYLNVLAEIGCKPGDLLFDYGCSWGYGSYQFVQAGYNVTAFEISVSRCEYAKTYLGINAQTRMENVGGPFDIFFSAHVLEHVPSVSRSLEFAREILRPGGWFVAFTPNGSDALRSKQQESWKYSWGLVHPNFLDDLFYSSAFKSDLYLLASSPYDLESIKQWASLQQASVSLDLGGGELLVIAKLSTVQKQRKGLRRIVVRCFERSGK